ncbi:MAG: hypothetical protein M3313_06365 [Actinomycetota bacterium]|nr:hypothetical protein [Actinomycetota bacterium]
MIGLTPGYAKAEAAQVSPVLPARAVYDSYGINTHFSFIGDTSTWANTDAAVSWVQRLGVGAVRQYLPRTSWGRDAVKRAMDALGVRWCCPTLTLDDFASLNGARAMVNEQLDWLESNADLDLLDSLPGLNEPNSDGKAVAEWVRLTRWAQQALYEETRRRSAFDDVLVQGPPLNVKGGPEQIITDVHALGDLSQWLDRGDAHLYPGHYDPGLLVDERLALVEPVHPEKPVCVSEGGYTTAVHRGYTGGADLVSAGTASLYGPKHLLVHAVAGRPFFSYETLDEAPPYEDSERTTREAGFGLVRTPSVNPASWVAKPGFDAIRRTLALFKDQPGHAAQGLQVEVAAASAELRTALFDRSDGKWLLAIWRAVDLYEWDPAKGSGRNLPVEELSVTITFAEVLPVTVYEPSTQDTPVDSFSSQSFSLTVTRGLVVLQIG